MQPGSSRPFIFRPLGACALVAIALLASACERTPAPADGAEGSDLPASKVRAAPKDAAVDVNDQAAVQAEAKRYYAELVKQYGQDYAACGPTERTLPEACDPAKDVPGAGKRSNVLLMLDASGSMAGRVGGETKMAAAQDALIDFTGKLAESADVALRVYGHTGNNQDSGKAESCTGSELLYPFQKLDASKFATAIRSFKPIGWTPIAASLEAAAQDFAKAPGKNSVNVVYVVSDGIETCDADPVAAARRLHESEIDVVVNVIGFDVDTEAARQLEAVAKAGGGEYLSANSRSDLDRIFNERYDEAQKRWNCVYDEQQAAWGKTYDAQQKRWNCLYDKAQTEWNDTYNHAQKEWNDAYDQAQKEWSDRYDKLKQDDSIDPDRRNALQKEAASRRDAIQALAKAKRDYAQTQAAQKRDGIQKPAAEERDRVQGAATELRDREQSAAAQERDGAQDAAREDRDAAEQERDADQQP